MVLNKIIYMGLGIGLTLVSSVLTYIFYVSYQEKRNAMPKKWRRIGILQQINIFPVKSCAPLKLASTDIVSCDILGLRFKSVSDRGLMIIDENNKMVTARVYPKMVLIETKVLKDGCLELSAPQMENLILDFSKLIEEAPHQDVHTAVWGVPVDGMLCGSKYNKWFSRFIRNEDDGLQLIYYPYPKPTRNVTNRLTIYPFIKQEDTGAFCDATSYMLMNLSSVNDLNTRLERPVDPLQFRSNFYLKMDKPIPYDEDNWKWLRIGDNVIFRPVAPCTRCIFPNINVETGERDPDCEPLKTLRKYRSIKESKSPALGIHLGIRQCGTIQVNDIIYVEDEN